MNQEEGFQERRKFARLKTSVDVKYTVIGNPGEIEVFSKDISAGGLCIVLIEELVADTPLQLEILVPDIKDAIRALARVVWQRKCKEQEAEGKTLFETGVEFTGLSDFDRFNLNRYILDKIESD